MAKPGKKHLGELLSGPGLYNFILNYIREMKNDLLTVLVQGQTLELLESLKVGLGDLHKLDENNIKAVKDSISSNIGYISVNRVQSNDVTEATTYSLTNFLKVIVDILSKKLPADVNFNNAKLEQVISKIKLISVPKTIREVPQIENGEWLDSNTNERAIVRLTIPHKMVEVEEESVDPATGNEVKQTVMKSQEIE